jgi:hypothetical protein
MDNLLLLQIFGYTQGGLISYKVIVSLIAGTKTKKGLKVDCEIDGKTYETGLEITDEQFAEINLCPTSFHGEWNYSILPE